MRCQRHHNDPPDAGWLGEVEGLKVSLAGASDKLAQIDRRISRPSTVHLGIPSAASALQATGKEP